MEGASRFHTCVIVADVEVILVGVTGADDTGFEVVALGRGDGCAGRGGGRGLGGSDG